MSKRTNRRARVAAELRLFRDIAVELVRTPQGRQVPILLLAAVFVGAVAPGLLGLAVAALAVVVVVVVCWIWPTLAAWLIERTDRRRTVRWLRSTWPMLMDRVGLADGVVVPALERLWWDDHARLIVLPSLLVGQTVEDVEQVADRLRQAVGATSVRVVANQARTGCRVVFTFGDPLAEPIPVELPTGGVVDPLAPVVGVTEDGEPWRLPLGPHTLIAGRIGAGKSSLVWSLLIGLGPAIHAGLVQVHAVDLKGGMELAGGASLFARYATTPAEAVELLENTAAAMRERAESLAGRTRKHTPSPGEPIVLVLVDEIAALTAYLPDRDLTKRASAALALVASQGRAVGFSVFACVQDPRKETLPMRGLFPRMIGLRLADRYETAMVLGDGALHAGAVCHTIPADTPGVAYVVPADGGPPVRVRAAYATDTDIHEAAQRFAPRAQRAEVA